MDYGKMVSGMLSGAWQKAGTIAEDIAGSDSFKKYYKRIVPGAEAFGQELSKSVSKRMSVQEAMSNTMNLLANNEEAFKAFQRVKDVGDIEKLGATHKLDSDLVDQLKMVFSKNLENAQKIPRDGTIAAFNPLDKAKESTIAYFTNPDKAIRNTRIAAAAGAYGGVAIASRYMNGGTLTRDQYGRRDIAGIPFI